MIQIKSYDDKNYYMREQKWLILASLSKIQENGPQTEATEPGNTMCIRSDTWSMCPAISDGVLGRNFRPHIQLFMICGLCLTFASDRVKYEWNLF